MKFSIKTLGCKINQFDAGMLSGALADGGAVMAADGEDADVYIIQTCTVTNKSDYHCRQAIRRAVKEKPEHARVVVTGCYAETSPEEIKNIPGVDLVVGNSGRELLPELLLGGKGPGKASVLSARALGGRSRAFLKVQEGCDSSCSYCIVPRARGGSRSAEPDDVLEKARMLVDRGYHEIVLTGVHLGAYGRDLKGRSYLGELVESVLEIKGLGRVRLSSLEPTELDEEMFSLIARHGVENGRLCRHFHIPLQSADDRILESMGRGYRWDDYMDVAGRVEKTAPGSCIGADVIVGYPLEDDATFENTLKRIQDSPINYLHVFSYSPRPGTRAHAMGDPVPGDVKKQRSAMLRAMAADKYSDFCKALKGKRMRVVAEQKEDSFTGLTDNYVRVSFDGAGIKPGSAATVLVNGSKSGKCRGVVI